MPRAGPRKVQRYSLEFKRKAVALSQLPDVEVQAVADALEIRSLHALALAEAGPRGHAAGCRILAGDRGENEDAAGAGGGRV